MIIGSGVVGSSTGKGFAAAGHAVRFVDIDAARVEALRGEGYAATTTVDLPDRPSFVFLTLPTPNQGHRYDLSAFVDGTRAVGRALAEARAFHTVVVRSTVPRGPASRSSSRCSSRTRASASTRGSRWPPTPSSSGRPRPLRTSCSHG